MVDLKNLSDEIRSLESSKSDEKQILDLICPAQNKTNPYETQIQVTHATNWRISRRTGNFGEGHESFVLQYIPFQMLKCLVLYLGNNIDTFRAETRGINESTVHKQLLTFYTPTFLTAACSNSTPPQMSQRALLQFPLLPFLEHKPLMHQWRETHVLSTLLVCPSKRSRRRGFYKDHSEFFRRGKALYLYSKLLSLNGG